jgi:hypothetical protein
MTERRTICLLSILSILQVLDQFVRLGADALTIMNIWISIIPERLLIYITKI